MAKPVEKKRRVEVFLDPAVLCCAKEFRSQRALDAHRAAHKPCRHGCGFEGSKAALAEHVCGVAAPSAPQLPTGITDEFFRKDGSAFTVVDEEVPAERPLEERFPGARIVRAAPPAAEGASPSPSPQLPLPLPPLPNSELPALADEWRIVLVLGRTGSGKSRSLAALAQRLGGRRWEPTWAADAAVVSQFGGRDEATRWLGAVGLNAVPLWCSPHHALSTGEGSRATLARQLQRAAHAREPLVLDDFCQHLDTLSAACCAAALARQLRRGGAADGGGGGGSGGGGGGSGGGGGGMRALVATCDPRVAHWLAPDAILVCEGEGASGAVMTARPFLVNVLAAARLPLRIVCEDAQGVGGADGVDGSGGSGASGASGVSVSCGADESAAADGGDGEEDGDGRTGGDGGWWSAAAAAGDGLRGGGGELFLWQLRQRVLGAHYQVDGSWRVDAAADGTSAGGGDGGGGGSSGGGGGGVVLTATVQTSDETRMCDELFDLPFSGVCASPLPRFPSAARLAAVTTSAGDGGSGGGGDGVGGGAQAMVGVITGPSGAAKSALMCEHFGAQTPTRLPPWDAVACVAAHLGGAEEAGRHLAAAALRPEVAARTYATLSRGEQAQADVARALCWCEGGGSGGGDGEGGDGDGEASDGSAGRLLLLDEFGSCWDAELAMRVAAALRAALAQRRGRCRGAVVASCHCGFAAALRPDWVFEAASGTLLVHRAAPQSPPQSRAAAATTEATGAAVPSVELGDGLGVWVQLARAAAEAMEPDASAASVSVAVAVPRVELSLRRCGGGEVWRRFRALHYKSAALSTSPAMRAHLLLARVVGGGGGDAGGGGGCGGGGGSGGGNGSEDGAEGHGGPPWLPCGFVATTPHNARRAEGARAPPRRAHRTVVLPEWQGLGVGSRLSDAVAEWHRRDGSDYFGQTVHPSFGGYRDASPLWRATEHNHTRPALRIDGWRMRQRGVAVRLRTPKLVFSHQYVGAAASDERARMWLAARVGFRSDASMDVIEEER